jgi:hypothetical protein
MKLHVYESDPLLLWVGDDDCTLGRKVSFTAKEFKRYLAYIEEHDFWQGLLEQRVNAATKKAAA